MPTNLPVPSKGALRALRHLALGTSCTIAFGAGMISEDRRRRIRSAREIHGNAQKIKTSRSYYSAGRALIDTLDDQVVDESIWLAGDPTLRKLTKDTNEALRKQEPKPPVPRKLPPPIPLIKYDPKKIFASLRSLPPAIPITKYDPTDPFSSYPQKLRLPYKAGVTPDRKWDLAVSSAMSSGGGSLPIFACEWKEKEPRKPIAKKPVPDPPEVPLNPQPSLQLEGLTRTQILDRQRRLATDVCKLLDTQDDLEIVQAAALRFLDAFEEGMEIDERGMAWPLVHAAARLSEACKKHHEFPYAAQIFDVVLEHPSRIDEETFGRFEPLKTISRLIMRVDHTFRVPLPEAKLKKAAAIYLMEFKEKPKIPTDLSLNSKLGERLCRETRIAGLYELTEKLYFRLRHFRQDLPPIAVDQLILACHGWGRHKSVFRYFKTFYSNTSPDQVQLYTITDRVIESVIKRGKMAQAEEVLVVADRLATAGKFPSSTTPILKVIGHYWRTTRDISKTEELFKRLETLAHNSNHPQAVYSAIIQCCIEAGEEDAAKSYYANFRAAYTPGQADVRIYGHFTLAKAMRNDWAGVVQDLQNMALLGASDKSGDFEMCFIPILTLFAKAHSVGDTEELVHNLIDQHQMKMTDRILNVMIKVYTKAKEVESLFRWIEYASSVGCPIDAVSVNTILNNCHWEWNMSFDNIIHLYRKIRRLEGPSRKITDDGTVEILGRIALTGHPSDEVLSERLKILRDLRETKQQWDPEGVFRAMATTFERDDFTATLKIYNLALERGIMLKAHHVLRAVQSSLALRGSDISEAVRFIRDAQQKKHNVDSSVAALMIHQLDLLEDSRAPVTERLQFAEAAVSSLERHGLKVSQSMLNHAMNSIIKTGHLQEAIGFWQAMCSHLKISTSEIDLESLFTLLKIYIKLQDGPGVQWIAHILSVNRLSPDTKFLVFLKNARKYSLKGPRGATDSFRRAVNHALSEVYILRRQHVEDQAHVKRRTIEIIEAAILDQERGGVVSETQYKRYSGRRVIDDWEEDRDELLLESNEEMSAALGEPLPPKLVGVTA